MIYKMGVVGLGVMGSNLARNIDSKDIPVAGYDLDAPKRAALTQISVRTDNKVVYLTGSVPTQQEKDLAGEVAQKVEHVQKVVNDLQVKP